MNKNSYKISKKAFEDLESIWIYTYENWSVEQADRYYSLIMNEIEFITDNFMSGKSMEHIKTGYRASKVKSHLIFYRKNKDRHIEIIRILHQRMGIENSIED
jgi:toxin ParE1/3/4